MWSYAYAVLPVQKICHTIENRYVEYSHITLILTHRNNITSDVINYFSDDVTGALKYGAIILDSNELPGFITHVQKSEVYGRFVVYIKSSNLDPKSWRIEEVFSEYYIDRNTATVQRANLVDADQAFIRYPHLNTNAGRKCYEAYHSVYKLYYYEESLKEVKSQPSKSDLATVERLMTSTLQHASFAAPPVYQPPTLPSAPYQDAIELISMNPVKKRLILDEEMVPGVQNVDLPARNDDAISLKSSEDISSDYQPLLFDLIENRVQVGLFDCFNFKSRRGKMGSRVEVERYVDRAASAFRPAIGGNDLHSAKSLLDYGRRVKTDSPKKPFYFTSETEGPSTPTELCKFVSCQWNYDVDILMALVYHTTIWQDRMMSKMVSNEIRLIQKMGRGLKVGRIVKIKIERKCLECSYDCFSKNDPIHYHSTLLDRLFEIEKGKICRKLLLCNGL